MAKKKLSTGSASSDAEHVGQLADAVEGLTAQVQALTSQVEVLRQVLEKVWRQDTSGSGL